MSMSKSGNRVNDNMSLAIVRRESNLVESFREERMLGRVNAVHLPELIFGQSLQRNLLRKVRLHLPPLSDIH